MSVIIRDKSFRIVRTSKNLRGINEHCRKVAVERVDIWPGANGGAQLGVTWVDGSSCITNFVCVRVCTGWCKARRAFPAAIIH